MFQQDAPGTQLTNRLCVVAHKENRPAVAGNVFHFAETFLLERGVTDSEHFVNEQDLGLEMRRDSKREPGVHARAVPFRRSVDELLDLGEAHDLLEATGNLAAPHSEYRAAQIDVLA